MKWTLRNSRKKVASVLCLTFALTLFTAFFTVTTRAEDVKHVTVRIDCGSADKNEVVREKYMVDVTNFDLTSYGAEKNGEAPTALHALIEAVGDEAKFSFSQYGVYISEILGAADDGVHSWMYMVNNQAPDVSADLYQLEDGDEIVFYYIGWQDGSYAYFDKNVVTVKAGETVNLKLTGNNFSEGDFSVDKAVIWMSEAGEAAAQTEFVTDEAGTVSIPFPNPGTYLVSATRVNEEGNVDISRPLTVVNVVAEKEEALLLELDKTAKTMSANGEDVAADVSFMQMDGEFYLPLRAIVEAFHGEVGWDEASATVTVSLGDKNINVTIGEEGAVISSGRTLVPIQFLEDKLGITVKAN